MTRSPMTSPTTVRAGEVSGADGPSGSWSDFPWPSWVPIDTRAKVMYAWKSDPSYSRIGGKTEVAGWMQNSRNNHAPEFGSRIVAKVAMKVGKTVRGRYLHGWSNLGFVIDDNGQETFVCCDGSTPDSLVEWMP